jgi:hypothetical protein
MTSVLGKYSALRRRGGAKRSPPSAARLVWREVSPQHFAHSAGGLYNGHSMPVTEPCEAHAANDTVVANGANLALDSMLQKHAWVLRLPIWAMSAQRADAHTLIECTHWCQPGPVSTWVIMLQHLLQAQPPPESTDGAAMSVTLYNHPPPPWPSPPSTPAAPPSAREVAPPVRRQSHAPPPFRAVRQMWQVLGLPTPPPSAPSAQALVRQEREQARLAKRAAALADRALRSTQRTPAASQNASKQLSPLSEANTGTPRHTATLILRPNYTATLNRPTETVDSFMQQTTVHMTALFAFATVTMATLCMLLLTLLGLLWYILPRLLQRRALRQRGANTPSAARRLVTRVLAIAGMCPPPCDVSLGARKRPTNLSSTPRFTA